MPEKTMTLDDAGALLDRMAGSKAKQKVIKIIKEEKEKQSKGILNSHARKQLDALEKEAYMPPKNVGKPKNTTGGATR